MKKLAFALIAVFAMASFAIADDHGTEMKTETKMEKKVEKKHKKGAAHGKKHGKMEKHEGGAEHMDAGKTTENAAPKAAE